MLSASRQQFVIAFIGPVGSGKTYISLILAKALGAERINTDDIRVALRRKGLPESRAIPIAHRLQERLLRGGTSIILDHDVVNPVRRRELRERLAPFGARIYFIKVEAPEGLILARLRARRYTSRDLFRNAEHAVRVHYIRRKFHEKHGGFRPDFTIEDGKSLEPQIMKIVKEIKGL